MKNMVAMTALVVGLASATTIGTLAQTKPRTAVPVTVDNFVRAETDLYFGQVATTRGGFGKFMHDREPTPLDRQTVIRMNRDTLYSAAVFDLDAGAVTITLPDAGTRFMSMQVIDEDQYTPAVIYAAGDHSFTRQQIGTRYVLFAVRRAFLGSSQSKEGARCLAGIGIDAAGREKDVRSIGSTSKTCRWTASGRSACTTPRGTTRRIPSMRTR